MAYPILSFILPHNIYDNSTSKSVRVKITNQFSLWVVLHLPLHAFTLFFLIFSLIIEKIKKNPFIKCFMFMWWSYLFWFNTNNIIKPSQRSVRFSQVRVAYGAFFMCGVKLWQRTSKLLFLIMLKNSK